MAVNAYDSHFGITQDALARGGGSNRGAVKRMSKDEYDRFMNSPAMLKQALQEEAVAAKTSKRDKRRVETDSSFKPQDSDWEQVPTFKFDRRIDYYRTLGVDEFEGQEGVKRAYRRLSLVYHPDKTHGLEKRKIEEFKQIFIELHNAYLVLSDNPTRRQYDKARDDQAIAEEVYGGKIGKRIPQFDAFVELEKIARRKSKPAKTVDVVLKVKLEKMLYGGIKRHRRARQREEFDSFVTETVPYELVVPPLCRDGYSILRKHTGDHHKDAQPDHLNFKLHTKEHPLVRREDEDLLLRRTLKLHKGAIEEPYTSLEISALGGRTLLLFGRNPFYGADKPATSRLHVGVLGEGFGSSGRLRFSVEYPSDHRAVEPAKPGSQPSSSPTRQMVVMVKHRDTGGECCVTVPLDASFGDVLEQMVQVLGLPGISAESFTLHKRLVYSDGLGPKLSPSSKVGTLDEIFCMGTNWVSASLSVCRSHEFVAKMCEAVGAAEDAFLKRPPPATICESVGDVSGAEPPVEVRRLLPYFGFPPSASGLHNALQAAGLYCADGAEELGARLHALAVGEAGGAFTPPARRTEPMHPLLRQRSLRAQGHPLECRTELVPLGALDLVTVPSSRLDFYSNLGQSAAAGEEGTVRARPLYAVVLSCPRGAHKAARKAWAELRRATMYLLVHTLWILVRPARSLIPRPLPPAPPTAKAFVLRLGLGPEGGWPEASREVARLMREVSDELEVRFEDMPLYPRRPPPRVESELRPPPAPCEAGKANEPHMPWDRLGAEALGRGDAWTAYACWSAQAAAESGARAKVAAALVRRAECLQRAGDEQGALADARTATQLQPLLSEAHRRMGELSLSLGFSSEARTALVRAVELDPHDRSGLELLQRLQRSKGGTLARTEKKEGNSSVKNRPAKAVALYTLALTAAADEGLRAELHSNRSAALARIGAWELAREDAMSALALRPEWRRSRLRLATALLALGRVEEAYPHFRRAELAAPTGAHETHPARRGREACLALLPLWRSPAGSARLARFWRDSSRRCSCTRVFALSDVHFDQPGADDWVARISGSKFQEDVLIVAGNVGESLTAVRTCLRHLRFKFRRIFFVPGNHDLWVHSSEEKEVPDSFAKLFRLLRLCDELDVDISPAAVCQGVFVVPLFSWYNADFDQDDPFPSSESDFDKNAKWPIDKDNHLPRYMLYLNRRFLEMPYNGTVVTFSHFLPRAELPYWSHVQGLIKAVGCPQLDPQLRQVNSSVHVFGHSHRQCDRVIEGVRYIQCPLGYQSEHAANEPLRCIFDSSTGGGLTSKPVQIED